jgi:O-acetyl-ADP-ribose deacetylase
MKNTVGDAIIETITGDITRETVDAIVNAANNSLLGGGGVDGTIHQAGGPAILEECRKLGGCETGDAKITTGGQLPAQYVIHTVGPVYRDGKHGEADLLVRCHQRSLEVALENDVKTIAFPAISCGVYGYPIPEAAHIAVSTVKSFLESHEGIVLVRFVLFGAHTGQAFDAALSRLA